MIYTFSTIPMILFDRSMFLCICIIFKFPFVYSSNIPMDCGDFLRRCLKKISEKNSPSKSYQSPKETFDCKNIQNTVTGNETIPQQHSISRSNSVLEPEDIKSLFQLSLEWKFECPTCRRYIVCSIKVTL